MTPHSTHPKFSMIIIVVIIISMVVKIIIVIINIIVILFLSKSRVAALAGELFTYSYVVIISLQSSPHHQLTAIPTMPRHAPVITETCSCSIC